MKGVRNYHGINILARLFLCSEIKTDEVPSGPTITSAPYNAHMQSTVCIITVQEDPGEPWRFCYDLGHLEMPR